MMENLTNRCMLMIVKKKRVKSSRPPERGIKGALVDLGNGWGENRENQSRVGIKVARLGDFV